MKKGILILAAGHPFYGRMAAALAASVQVCDATVPIHLAYAGDALKHLSESELSLFKSSSEIPAECYKGENQKWIRSKMFMYDLSPFEETLYVDSDVLWLTRSPKELFKSLKNVKVTFPNFGYEEFASESFESNAWVDVQSVKYAYGFKEDKYYHIHSELVYFKKCEAAEKYFNTAKDVYDNLKCEATTFAGALPDELPFSIACTIENLYPHQTPFRPFYWYQNERGLKQVYELAKDFYAVSMAGNNNTKFETDLYNTISSAAYQKLGLQQAYKWKAKNTFLPERKYL